MRAWHFGLLIHAMIHFSKRTDWDLSQNELTNIQNAHKSSGRRIYDLTVSNPTVCGIDFPQAKIDQAFHHQENSVYHPHPRGLAVARDAVREYYAQKGVKLSADQIFLTSSTSEAYSFLFRLLADPYDGVIFPKPSYPLFEFLSDLHDLNWATYQLVYENGWRLDEVLFRSAMENNPKAIVLVNPNNPTGSCLNKGELDLIYSAAALSDAPIICDEVFLDYSFDETKEIRTLAGRKDHLTFVLGGVSKALALPQMKCSWIAVSGPQKDVSDALSRLEVIADTYLSVNTPVQNALPVLMNLQPEIRSKIMERVSLNRNFLSEAVKSFKGDSELLRADGGWTAVLRSSGADEEQLVVRLLREKDVLVHPGYFFNFQESGFFVISLLLQEEIFQEGIRRLLTMLRR
ncbi:MAG: pyridoxal phosphate-dependent aminotransferase [Candidatus Omnitrophota bacterium]